MRTKRVILTNIHIILTDKRDNLSTTIVQIEMAPF